MAKTSDIQELIDACKLNLVKWKFDTIVEETKGVMLFDIKAAITELSRKNDPGPADVSRIIQQCEVQRTYCGLCREGWIPVLDWRTWNEAGQPDLNQRKVFIPKMDVACPTCQPNRHPSLSERLAKMTEAERGWTFCILYDFYVYSLENDAKMDDFDPHRLWGVFQQEPHLTGAMMGFMAWINHGLDERLEQAKAKAQEQKARQVIHTAATARAFGT